MKRIKKQIIAIILASTSILAIGCQSSNNSNEANIVPKKQSSSTPKESNTENNQQAVNNNTNEDLDKLNKELLPEIEKVLKESGIEIKDAPFDEGEKKPEDIFKLYNDKSNTKAGEITQVQYASNSESKIWGISLAMNTTKDMFGGDKFNIEDTLFYKISNLIIGNEIDYSALNKEINDTGSSEDGQPICIISKQYGDYQVGLIFTETYTMFSIDLNK